MATSYTTFLGLALPVTGELSGTWGDTVNNYISNYLDAAIAGAQTVTTDTTLTKTTGSSLDATSSQYAIIIASPASANITITAPAASKIYTIINTSATYTVKIRGAGPTTGVTLGVSEKAQVAWNGSDFVRIGASGGPGVFSSITNTGLTSGRVVYSTTGGLETDSANLTFNGTTLTANTLNLTNALGTTYGGTGLTSFTSGGVVYASSSSALTTGSALTFDGTNLALGRTALAARILTVQGRACFTASANDSQLAIYSDGSTNGIYSTYNSTGSYLPMTFYINDVEQMRLNSTGLGIGTSSPATKLQVVATTSSGAVSNAFALTQAGSGSGTGTSLFVGYGTSTGQYGSISGFFDGVGTSLTFGTSSNAGVAAVTEKMRLDGSGNLGLGGTPSASSLASIQSAYGITIGNNEAHTTKNAYYNAGWKYATTTTAARFSVGEGGSDFRFYTAASGTAGNAITFTQAMTLDASGNLGIGTTTPNASAILDAQSTTKGVRMPNMTTTQKNAIASPAAGLMVFDTTLAKLCVYSGSAWQTITSI
jgi:hypothetical protein